MVFRNCVVEYLNGIVRRTANRKRIWRSCRKWKGNVLDSIFIILVKFKVVISDIGRKFLNLRHSNKITINFYFIPLNLNFMPLYNNFIISFYSPVPCRTFSNSKTRWSFGSHKKLQMNFISTLTREEISQRLVSKLILIGRKFLPEFPWTSASMEIITKQLLLNCLLSHLPLKPSTGSIFSKVMTSPKWL